MRSVRNGSSTIDDLASGARAGDTPSGGGRALGAQQPRMSRRHIHAFGAQGSLQTLHEVHVQV